MPDFRRFERSELAAFLRALDGCLEAPARMIVIGGGAAAIAYDVEVGTEDIDTFDEQTGRLEEAVREARRCTGLQVPVSRAAVADLPWNFEDRLARVMRELANLELYVPEKHDLALSKVVRGYEHDFQQIRELHERRGLDVDTLVSRHVSEMGHAIGDPGRLRDNFLELVERLFGELESLDAERRLDDAGR